MVNLRGSRIFLSVVNLGVPGYLMVNLGGSRIFFSVVNLEGSMISHG